MLVLEDMGICADSETVRDQVAVCYVLSSPPFEDICDMFGLTEEFARWAKKAGINPFPEWFQHCVGIAWTIKNRQ